MKVQIQRVFAPCHWLFELLLGRNNCFSAKASQRELNEGKAIE
jgi:hypothetical protein